MIYYAIIPLLVFLVLGIGYLITQLNLKWYHNELLLPDTVPPDWVFSVVWSCIGVLTALSLILFWRKSPRDRLFWLIIALFIINGLLNIGWVATFFGLHRIEEAYWVAVALEVNLVVLITLLFSRSWVSALLLVPYVVWVAFAIYLNYELWFFNEVI